MFDRINCFDSQGNCINSFTQWDINQTVYVENWEYNFQPIFHFCNIKSDNALVVKGSIESDGRIKCSVPNILLTEPHAISVFVYLENENVGRTIHIAQIPVAKKIKPHDYYYKENIEYISWVKLEAEAKALINELESNIKEFENTLGSAKDNADKANQFAIAAKESENESKNSEIATKESETKAKESENKAKNSETAAKESKMIAKSYAVGGTDIRDDEDNDNAKYYYLQTKALSDSLGGVFLPQGTIEFAELKSVEKIAGYSYHISDDFVTDDTFRCGAGIECSAGTDVYYTSDGNWDYFVHEMKDVVYTEEFDDEDSSEDEVIPLNADTLGGRPADEFASKNFVTAKIAEAQLEGEEVDLSGFATKDDVGNHTNNKNNPHGITIEQIGAAQSGYVTYTGYFSSEDMLNTKLFDAYSRIADGCIGFTKMDSTSNAVTLTSGTWFFTIYRTSENTGLLTAVRYGDSEAVTFQRSLIGGVWQSWVNCSPSAFAPSGYGLGGMSSKMIRSVTELDGYTNGGWYYFACPGSTIGNVYLNYGSVFVHPFIEGNCVQELRPLNTNTVLRRFSYSGTWSEWEVENPPMALGVEYRTTERWNGKTVFCKIVDCGKMPNATTKSIDILAGTTCRIIRCKGTMMGGTNYLTLPFKVDATHEANCHGQNQNVVLYANYDLSDSYNAYVTAWYTKD